jgi:PAS domain S-box-containing protein
MTCRVLVVEDSATQAEALRSLLEEEGYEVTLARSAEMALERLAEGSFDLILSDIVMPGMSGIELCRRVKADARNGGIPFVLLTSLADPMDIVRGLECGADNYITKPYDQEHLLARLRHVQDIRRLRRNAKTSLGVSVRFLGKELAITSEKEQILDLFISSVEDVVRTNEALQRSRAELAEAHAKLAEYAERKTHEARVSTERYRTLLQSAGDAIFVLDPQGRILELNRRAAELLRVEGGAATGTSIHQWVPGAMRAEFTTLFANLSRDGQVNLGVQSLAGEGRPEVLAELTASLSRLDDEEDLVLLIARDVTERQRTAERLREANQRLTTLIQASPLAIVVLDRDLHVEVWNEAAERAFGWSAEEVLHRPNPLVAESRAAESRELDERLLRGESVDGVDLPMLRKDGEIVEVSTYAAPLVSEAGKTTGIMLLMADITERREAERAVLLRDQAEQANRAKSEFLSRMSHELRTPLNAILGFAQLMEMEDLDQEQRESVGQILRGGRHLLDLINEVLDLSRIEAGRLTLSLEPVSVQTAVSQAMSLVSPLASEMGLRYTADAIDAELFVTADIQRLKQVLLNLLSNAVKYNRPNGSVHVSVTESREGWARIGVHDTGQGIAEAQIPRLFSPFERLDMEARNIPGTGLGLVLARALAEAMRGEMGVESEVGAGSTFWIELPRSASPLAGSAAISARPAPTVAAASPKTVLYVEDNPSNLRLVERVLASRPQVHLLTAVQGRVGIQLAEETRPDLVLLDVNLPDIPGDEVYRLLRSDPTLADVPVVVVSADAMGAQVRRFLDLGVREYLTKPIDVKRLLRIIDECLWPDRA